jgi:predicted transport protein
MPTSPEQMTAAIIRNLPAKTGRTLDAWLAIIGGFGAEPPKARVARLKTEYSLGHVTAETLVYLAERPADYTAPTPDELLAAQYAGPKAALLPIHALVVKEVERLGEDVTVEVRQTYVAFTRGKQFALVQPSTRERADLGLKLPGIEPTERLRAAGSFGSGQISHRVALRRPEDVDAEVAGWLLSAYEAAGAARRRTKNGYE